MDEFSTFGDNRRRRRRKTLWRLVRWTITLAVLVLFVGLAYQVGLSQNQSEVERQQADIDDFLLQINALSRRVAGESQAARDAQGRIGQLEARYARDVPRGELRALIDLIKSRLDEGLPAERLEFVISQTTEATSCTARTETKRFLMHTSISTGAVSSVSFGGNRITVTGQGATTRNEQGQPQAWFDPGQSVQIRFMQLDGEVENADGMLPLSHSMVVDGREYRFTITNGEQQGFVDITGQNCDWP
jgi:hypothetical protein